MAIKDQVVSIPFKRESPSKHGLWSRCDYAIPAEFQFPSSGKVHPNYVIQNPERADEDSFQFPSSGKVHPNWLLKLEGLLKEKSFNSLQAGKSIQTPAFLDIVRPWLRTPKTKHELHTAFLALK